MAFQMIGCPHCKGLVEIRLLALYSGLGPPSIACPYCHQPMSTERDEWPEMTDHDKWRYGFITLIYMVMLGLLTGNAVNGAYRSVTLQPKANLEFLSQVFQGAAVAGAIIALALQIYRIFLSCARAKAPQPLTLGEFISGIQWNLQCKCLLGLIVIWGTAEVVGIARLRALMHR